MKKKNWITGCITALFILSMSFALVSCGSSEETEEVEDYGVQEITLGNSVDEEGKKYYVPSYDMQGMWQTEVSDDDHWIEADIAEDTIILRSVEIDPTVYTLPISASGSNYDELAEENIEMVEGVTVDLYWMGSFASPGWKALEDVTDYQWTSVIDFDRSDDIETAIPDDVLDFYYSATDKLLTCTFTTNDGYTQTIELFKYSNMVPTDIINEYLELSEPIDVSYSHVEDEEDEDEDEDEEGTKGITGGKSTGTSKNNTTEELQSTESPDIETNCIHYYERGVVTKEATCTEDGIKEYKCTKCGRVKTEIIPATGHNYQEAITKYSTCTTQGVKTYTCYDCGDYYTVSLPLADHNWKANVETVTTKEEGHYETKDITTLTYFCSECADEEYNEQDMINHINEMHEGIGTYHSEYVVTDTQDEWVVDVPESSETITTYICSVCGATRD